MNLSAVMDSLPGKVLKKFLDDQAPNWAVLIAWNGLFAIFPIVVFLAAVIGYVARIIGETRLVYCQPIQTRTTVLDCTLLAALPSQVVGGAFDAIKHFEQLSGLLLIVGVVGILWGGSALFGAMEQAFAVIYHTRPREFVPQKVMSFGMIFLFTALGGLAAVSSVALPAIHDIPAVPGPIKDLSGLLQPLIGFVAGFILFSCIYFVVPNRPQQFQKVLPGAALAGVLFEVVTLLFPLYINLTKSAATYGQTFGLFFVVLTFFYFIGLITMLGVELNSVIYPVALEQPARGQTITAAPKTAGEARRRGGPAQEGAATPVRADNGGRRNGATRKGLHPRTALGLAVVASLIGALVGRRTAGSD